MVGHIAHKSCDPQRLSLAPVIDDKTMTSRKDQAVVWPVVTMELKAALLVMHLTLLWQQAAASDAGNTGSRNISFTHSDNLPVLRASCPPYPVDRHAGTADDVVCAILNMTQPSAGKTQQKRVAKVCRNAGFESVPEALPKSTYLLGSRGQLLQEHGASSIELYLLATPARTHSFPASDDVPLNQLSFDCFYLTGTEVLTQAAETTHLSAMELTCCFGAAVAGLCPDLGRESGGGDVEHSDDDVHDSGASPATFQDGICRWKDRVFDISMRANMGVEKLSLTDETSSGNSTPPGTRQFYDAHDAGLVLYDRQLSPKGAKLHVYVLHGNRSVPPSAHGYTCYVRTDKDMCSTGLSQHARGGPRSRSGHEDEPPPAGDEPEDNVVLKLIPLVIVLLFVLCLVMYCCLLAKRRRRTEEIRKSAVDETQPALATASV